MCTIALLPGPPGHLLLVGNRDEMRQRPKAHPPSLHTLSDGTSRALYPVDAQAGGTWIGVNHAQIAMTLLNNYQAGAIFEVDGPPRSRGLIIPELLHLDTLEDIERALRDVWFPHARSTFPFVLFAAGAQFNTRALRASWNGHTLEIDMIATPLVSISSGFDLEGVTASRQRTLDPLLQHLDWTTPEGLTQIEHIFAQGHPHPDAYSVTMSRDDAHTVSHTRVLLSPTLTQMTYFDGPITPGAHAHTIEMPEI